MKSLWLAPAALLLLAACGEGEKDKSYTGETTASHDCSKEPLLAINTSGGTLTFTSVCERITINGDGNNVKIEAASTVAINGAKNAVEIGATDKINIVGSNNTIHYQKTSAESHSPSARAGTTIQLPPCRPCLPSSPPHNLGSASTLFF